MALRRDGTVVEVGNGYNNPVYGTAEAVARLRDVVAIAAGYRHSLALRRDGSVVSWGRAPAGRERALAGHEVLAIAAGLGFDLAVVRAHPPV